MFRLLGKAINWIEKHPYLSAAALLTAYAGAIGVNEYNKDFADSVDHKIENAKSEILMSVPTAPPITANNISKINEMYEIYKSNNTSNTPAKTDNLTYQNLSNEPPVAKIKIDAPLDWVEGETFVFNASKSYDPDGEIVEYSWYIPELNKKSEAEVTTSPIFKKRIPVLKNAPWFRTYHIILNVKDDKGKISVAETEIEVKSRQAKRDENFLKTFAEPINYNGIKIEGPEYFQEKIVMAFEFAKKYSPPDYEFIRNNTKTIFAKSKDFSLRYLPVSGAYFKDGIVAINVETVEPVNNNYVKNIIRVLAHEAGHSYADSIPGMNEKLNKQAREICEKEGINTSNEYWIDLCTLKLGKYDMWQWLPSELFAKKFEHSAMENLSYVNESEIDKFIKEFNFSKLKK